MAPLSVTLLLACALFSSACAQTTQVRLCNAQTTCGDCIRAPSNCSWCADPSLNGTRCFPSAAGTSCSDIQDPSTGVNMTNMEPLHNITQISPSRIVLDLRVGEQQTVPLSVRPARNFPIDLYLLMDLSFSMRDDLDNLKALGASLAEAIVGISTNFTIGFGSFVDKCLAPFVNIDPNFLLDPCFNGGGGCLPPYSYRHVITLTNNETFFNEEVQKQNISGNQDPPEGGFDGLLQAIVCKDIIGWRPVSRKLLLFITDAGFHFSGDGKLGGVVKPHDGLCKLTPSTDGSVVEYNDWDSLDYPSIGQIAEKLHENDIIPIFAAETRVKSLYDALVSELGEGAYSGTLAEDSSNVVTLVQQLYDEISQNIHFEADQIDGINFEFSITDANCPGTFANGICTGVEIEDTAIYDVGVTLEQCTEELINGPVTANTRVVGFGNFQIVINTICNCNCEQNPVPNDADCSGNGTAVCGLCECNPGRFGKTCQCNASGQAGGTTVECPLGDNGEECSGRGTCTCGVCSCNTNSAGQPLYSGSRCECDNSVCQSNANEPLCSNRGECGCDGCNCRIEPNTGVSYSGNFCQCTPDTSGCRDPNNATDLCNGRGGCDMCEGVCTCNTPYFGQFCGECSGDPIYSSCSENKNCFECAAEVALDYIGRNSNSTAAGFFRSLASTYPGTTEEAVAPGVTGVRLPEGLCNSACDAVYFVTGDLPMEYTINGFEAIPCTTLFTCIFTYHMASDNNDVQQPIHIEFPARCSFMLSESNSVAPWIIAIAITIPLLILGILALLLLKLILLILDAIEVRKFQEELRNQQYKKSAQNVYKNAAYSM